MKGPGGAQKLISLFLILSLVFPWIVLFGCTTAPDFSSSTKVVDRPEAPPGSFLAYTINVTNTGAVASTNTQVTDRLEPYLEEVGNITGGGVYDLESRTITWDLGGVASGSGVQLSFTARIAPSTPSGTEITNYATISYQEGGPTNTSTASTTVIPGPLHHFEFASIPSPQVTYRPFEVTIYAKDQFGNLVSSFAGEANLSDSSGSISPQATRSFTGGIWSGEVTIFQARLADTVTASYQDKTGIFNPFDVLAAPPVLNTSGKSVDLDRAAPGEILLYTLRVINSGNGPATSVVVTDSLDAHLTAVSQISGGGTYDPAQHRVTWNLGEVAPSSEVDLTFSAEVATSAPAGTTIKNRAIVDCSELEPFTTPEVETLVIPGPLHHFRIAPVPGPQLAGSSFSITIYAEDLYGNTITSFADSVTLSDATGTLSPALSGGFEEGIWTGEVVISQPAPQDQISVSDRLGHQGTSNSFAVLEDTEAPLADIASPAQGEVLTGASVMVTGTAQDQFLDGWQLFFQPEGSSDWAPVRPRHAEPVQNGALDGWDLSSLDDGVVYLKLVVQDRAGHLSEEIVAVIVERHDPVAEISSPQEGGVIGGLVAILGSALDGNLKRYLLSYGEGANPQVWFPIPATGSSFDARQDISSYAEKRLYSHQDGRLNLDLAQTFISQKEYVDRVEVALRRSGSGEAALGLKICETQNGMPTFTVVAESVTALPIFSIPASGQYNWFTFEFRGQRLEPGKTYCLVLYRRDGQVDDYNYAAWRHSDQGNYYPDGSPFVYNGSSWSWTGQAGMDFCFRIYSYREEDLYGTGKVSSGTLATWSSAETADGTYTIKLEVEDNYGKRSFDLVGVVVDNTPPTARIASPLSGSLVTGLVNLQGTASDAHLKRFRIYYGVGETPDQFLPLSEEMYAPVDDGLLLSWDTATFADGTYTVKLEAEDLAGLRSEFRVALTVDNTAPVAAITHPASGTALKGRVFIQGAASDAHFSSYTVSYTHDQDPYSQGVQWHELVVSQEEVKGPSLMLCSFDSSLMASAPIWLQLVVSDELGHQSTVFHRLFIDNTPPLVQFSTPSEGEGVSGMVRIQGTVFDPNLAGFTLHYARGADPSPDNDWTSINLSQLPPPGVQDGLLACWDTSGLEEGSYILRLQAADTALNYSSTFLQVTVNNLPPQGNIRILGYGPDSRYTHIPLAKLELSFDYADYYALKNEGSEWTGWLPVRSEGNLIRRIWLLTPGEGEKVVWCRFMDSAGQRSQEYFSSIVLESTPPDISILSPTNQQQTSDALVHFSIRATDPVSAGGIAPSGVDRVDVYYSLGGSPLEHAGSAAPAQGDLYSLDFNLESSGYGYYSFVVKARDRAGNVRTSGQLSLYYCGVPGWPMAGYDLKNSNYNSGVKQGDMLPPFEERWVTTLYLHQYEKRTAPVVTGGYLYYAAWSSDIHQSVVRKLSLDSGEEVASYRIGDDEYISWFCVSGGRVYALSREKLFVLSSDNLQLDPEVSPNPLPIAQFLPAGEYFNQAPVASGEYLYLPTSQYLLALRTSDLAVAWSFQRGTVGGRPALCGGKIVFTGGGNLLVLDAASGQELRRFTPAAYTHYLGAPTIYNGRVYVTCKDWGETRSWVEVFKLDTGAREAQTQNLDPTSSEIAVANGIFYVSTSYAYSGKTRTKLYAFDASTASTMWVKEVSSRSTDFGNDHLSTPAVAGGKLYAVFWMQPGIYDQIKTKLMVFDAYTGRSEWESPEAFAINCYGPQPDPAVATGRVYFNYFSYRTACLAPVNAPSPENLGLLGFDTFCGFYDEINTSIGSFTTEVSDLVMPARGMDLDCKRTYNSARPQDGPLGYGWSFSYDVWLEEKLQGGVPTEVRVHHGDGRVDTYLRQSDGTYKAPSGVFNQLTYHPGANPRYTLKFQGEDYWQFDDRGKLVMMVDDHSPGDDPARDNLLTLDYAGPEGRLSRITAPGGRSVNVSWEGGHISSLAGPEGKTVSFNYQDGNLVQVTDIYGGATRYTYDEHRLTSMVEPEGNQVKRIEYYPPGDPNEGLVKKTIDAFGNETAFAYAVTAHETLITDPEGYTTTHRYDALYRLIQEVDNQGNSTIYCYGEDGNGKSIRDPEGRVTEFLSERGRVRRIVAPDGGVRSYDYDSLDRVIKEVNEEGSAKEFHYDERNNLAWETDFSGARTDYFYTDPANPGLPTFKVRPPLDSQQRPTTQFVYEANGDLKEEILYEGWIGDALHPAGVSPLYRKVFTYDGMGRKVLEVICDPLDPGKKQEFSYSYDDDVTDDGSRGVTRANLSYEVNGCHPEEVTRYDRNGRVKESLTFRGEEGRIAWVKTAYSYDGNDRETERMLFTSPDPQASGFVQVYQPMAKSYLKNGFVASESDYSGRLVAYRYDQTGRVAEQENQEGHITTFSYFRDGKVRERKDPFSTGSVIFNYDAAGRESVVTRNLQTLEGTSLTYTTRKVYNRRGNVITEEVVRVDPSDPGNPALFRMIRTSYQYDKEERLIRVVRPVEPLPGEVQVVTTYTYDNLGNKTSETITSPGSPERKTTWEYNALGKVVAERRFCSFIDSQGRVTTEVYVTWYTYDFLGNVVAETVTSGEGALAPVLSHRRYAYNGLSRVEGVYVALGDEANDFSLGSFEGVNNLPLQEVATYRYYCDGLLSWEVRRNLGSPDQQVSYSYDALGKKTGESLNRGDGVSFLKAYSYDGSGNLLSESIGSEGELRTTAYAYDLAGRLTRKVLPPAYPGEPEGQRAYTVNYLDEERARVETDPEGRSIRRTFDDLGREELTEGPGDYYALVAYDEAGRIVSQRVRLERREGDDTFKVTLSRYDDLGRKKSETTIGPAGEEFTTSFAYDAGGNLTSLTTPEGNLTRYYYDSLGRLRLQSLPHDAGTRIDTEFRYDALGRKTLVLQGGTDATRFTYDGLSHLRKVEQWAGPWDEQLGRGTGTLSETRYQYDLAGSLLAQTDAEGHTTAFSYNGCGWLTGVVDPLGRRQSYSYTPQGEMGSRSFFDPESGSPARTLFFSYDGRGRLKEKGARSPSGAELEKISYFYDRSGNLTRATEGTRRVELSWDGAGRLASVSSIAPEDSYQTSFAWYDSGELASRSGPQGTTTYSYDGAGRLAGIHDETGSYALSWDRDGRLISLDLPGGAHLEYNYYADGLFRTQEAYSPAAERQARFSFSYDRRGKRVAMSVELAGNPQGINGDYTYSYDCMGRIVGFSPPPALGAPETYSYDRVGNRVEVTRGGESKTYSYDSACQLVSCSDGTTYAYDLFGNLVSETKGEDEESYSYDPLLRLSSFRDASGEVAFSYDSLGRMARRAKGEEALLYRYDGSSFEPIQELDSQGETLSSFTLALDGTPLAERGTEGTSFLALNPHSDLAFALSSSGLLKGMKIYSPWGEELASTLPSPLGFQHDYTDPDSGLVFMQARWYSPELSSFLSPDPKPGEPTDPLGRNPYPYCSDDPVNRLDPTGETPRELMMMLRNPRAALYLLRHPELMTVIMLYQPGMSPAYASFVKKTVARVAARRMAARSRALRGNELPPPTQLSPAAAGIAGGGDRPRGVLPYPPGQAAKRHPC